MKVEWPKEAEAMAYDAELCSREELVAVIGRRSGLEVSLRPIRGRWEVRRVDFTRQGCIFGRAADLEFYSGAKR